MVGARRQKAAWSGYGMLDPCDQAWAARTLGGPLVAAGPLAGGSVNSHPGRSPPPAWATGTPMAAWGSSRAMPNAKARISRRRQRQTTACPPQVSDPLSAIREVRSEGGRATGPKRHDRRHGNDHHRLGRHSEPRVGITGGHLRFEPVSQSAVGTASGAERGLRTPTSFQVSN